jgi:hypothetical protein
LLDNLTSLSKVGPVIFYLHILQPSQQRILGCILAIILYYTT